MGLFSALVHIVKSNILYTKNAIDKSKDDGCHICKQIVPKHSFEQMIGNIREVTIHEGEMVILDASDDKAVNRIEL